MIPVGESFETSVAAAFVTNLILSLDTNQILYLWGRVVILSPFIRVYTSHLFLKRKLLLYLNKYSLDHESIKRIRTNQAGNKNLR